MSSETPTASPTDVRALLGLIELKQVRTHELSGRRRETPKAPGTETEPDDSLHVLVSAHGSSIEVRLRQTLPTPEAILVADISAIFESDHDLTVPDDVMTEFIEKVAAMAVIPYLREGISTTAARLGVPVPLMRLIRQGEFSVRR